MGATARSPFGATLRRFRLAAGLTQAALAARAGLSERAINDLERDPRRTPRLETVTLLAEALGLSPGDRVQLLAAARPETYASEHPLIADASPPAAHRGSMKAPEYDATISRAPAAALSSRSKLPAAPNPFVGRAHEVAAVCARLCEPGIRLLTLTGPGGIGKTRLALEVAARLESAYADGARFVALGSVTDPARTLPTIAAALDLPESAYQSEQQRLVAALGGRELLLVLDNFEQLRSAAMEIEQLLTACPTLSILVTSRSLLRLAREHEYVVPPLTVPDLADIPAPADLLTYDAVALFAQRAQSALPEFTVTEANAHAVATICSRLDGAPLAIQLAAARLKLLTPAALLARLDHQLAILTGGPQDAPERQRTVRATLDWSYHLLTAPQQRLLRRLAVFASGWTLDAAEGICAGEGLERAEILDLLGSLVDHSLVMVEERDDAPRYRLLETIRQYAEEKLRVAGEEAHLRERHFAWFLRLAEELDGHTWVLSQTPLVQRLCAEGENFRAALAWSRCEQTGESELRLAGALKSYWTSCGTLKEGRQTLRDALQRGDLTARTAARARALMVAAGLAGAQTDPVGAGQLIDEAIAILRELGEAPKLAQALVLAARLRQHLGIPEDCTAARDESLRICRQQSDPRALAEMLLFWAELPLEQGDYATARRQLEECATVCRQLNDPLALSMPLISLARVACAEGDVVRARRLAEEGVALRKDSPSWLVAIALASLGEVERCAGDDERASALFMEALATFRDQSDSAGIAWSLHNLGQLALHAGEAHLAAAHFTEALTIRQRHGYLNGIASELAGLAGVRCQAGKYERAARLFGAAETLLERSRSVLAPADKIAYEHVVATLREIPEAPTLDEAWAAAFVAGRALSLEQAIAEALSEERENG